MSGQCVRNGRFPDAGCYHTSRITRRKRPCLLPCHGPVRGCKPSREPDRPCRACPRARRIRRCSRTRSRYRALERLRGFRQSLYECLDARADALFELADAVLCADHAVTSLGQLCLEPEFPSGPCHCQGSSKTAPGWEYQLTAAIGHLRTAWAALAEVARTVPATRTAQTIAQVNSVLRRLSAAGHGMKAAPLFIFDAGYSAAALTDGLLRCPVRVLVRLAAGSVFYADPLPWQARTGRPAP